MEFLKDSLLNYLKNQTAFLDLDTLDELFTAKKLAEIFGVKRNTVSHYLNQLNDEEKLVKINSRPVYYFHKSAFDQQFFPLKYFNYQGIYEIKEEQPLFEEEKDLFSLLIGYNQSLNRSIEQIKAALSYPDGGLPALITGDSGTGKSFLVRLIYQYCLEHEIIKEGAPFVTVNCAQYANNPELLTSNLFGHIKGAFTGAQEDKKGAFEAANNGILFLDEVHRLNDEGQEKLFTFLDQGVIYRMGETNQAIPINTRIFFATTENLESSFLTTFIRRIPIQVELPSLTERSKAERLELVYSFLLAEYNKIRLPIKVTGQVLSLLISAEFKGNIGELKSSIKVTIAKAFSEQKQNDQVKVTIYHLPETILNASSTSVQSSVQEDVLFDEHVTMEQLINKNQPQQQRVLTSFERMFIEFQQNDEHLKNCEEQLKTEVDRLFDFLLFETDRQQKHETLIYLTQYIRDTFKQMEASYQIRFDGNSIYAISYYLFQRGNNRWASEDQQINRLIHKLEQQIEHAYPASFRYVERILELCQPKLDLEISSMDKIILAVYLKRADWAKEIGIPKAIIVAHGYATASSIANVANRFLNKDIFESFDMPLDITPQQIAEEILDYTEHNDISNGLVILVDMGSLKEIYQYFPKQITAPVVIMNNVTTPLAISMGEQLQKDLSLQEMVDQSAQQAPLDWEIIYPETNKMKALITTCFTGIGTATQISHLLEKSLPKSCELKIFPYEYQLLKDKKRNETIFSMYDCLGIIGTANPNIEGIPYLSLEELISGNKSQQLNEWLTDVMEAEENKRFNENLVRNFSLEKVIDSVTILDTEKVMREVDLFMRDFEQIAQMTITNAKRVALYVHISCLIERLIRNMPINTYNGYEKLYQCQNKTLEQIKFAFSVIEKDYSVKIPDSEIAYIFDVLFKNLDEVTTDEEF